MAALIGALRVSLSADTAQFDAGMRKAQSTASSASSSIQKSLGALKAGVAGFVGALSVGMVVGVIKNALEYAGSLAEVAQQLGVTTKDLQTFRFAAGQVGVSQEQLETGLSKLTITLGKVAAGAEAPTKALKAIGVSAEELKGKDTGEAFRVISDALQKVTDRSQRAAVEVALFGKSGAQLDNMLSGGSAALNALTDAAEKLGIVLSDEQIQKADDTADKIEALKTVLSANIASVVADNADSILTLANALGTLLDRGRWTMPREAGSFSLPSSRLVRRRSQAFLLGTWQTRLRQCKPQAMPSVRTMRCRTSWRRAGHTSTICGSRRRRKALALVSSSRRTRKRHTRRRTTALNML
jgi:hypothetical protein